MTLIIRAEDTEEIDRLEGFEGIDFKDYLICIARPFPQDGSHPQRLYLGRIRFRLKNPLKVSVRGIYYSLSNDRPVVLGTETHEFFGAPYIRYGSAQMRVRARLAIDESNFNSIHPRKIIDSFLMGEICSELGLKDVK